MKPPAVIELRADLGGGKTTFVRGLAHGFGSKNIVASPTFTLNKIYKNGAGQEIHHFDFYRLNDPGVMADQLAESLEDKKVITVIEWSDIVKEVLPKDHMCIELKPTATDPDEREMIVNYPEADTNLIKQLENSWAGNRP